MPELLLRGGAVTLDRRLDRVHQADRRNARYALAPRVQGLSPRSRGWQLPFRLDQGDDGACTGFGATYDLLAAPAMLKWSDRVARLVARPGEDVPGVPYDLERWFGRLAFLIYEEARRQDEWPGEDYDGSSVLGAARALKVLGFIGEYRWAGEAGSSAIDDVVLALGHVGPVVFGTDVTDDWYEPGPGGLLGTGGSWIGGHSYAARGVLVTASGKRARLGLRRSDAVRDVPLLYGPNSWGYDYGNRGEWAMYADDMERLLAGVRYPGEARVTTEAYRQA